MANKPSELKTILGDIVNSQLNCVGLNSTINSLLCASMVNEVCAGEKRRSRKGNSLSPNLCHTAVNTQHGDNTAASVEETVAGIRLSLNFNRGFVLA